MKILVSSAVLRASHTLYLALETCDLYVVGEPGGSHEDIEKISWLNPPIFTTFVPPKTNSVAWKANLAKSLKVGLYLDNCEKCVEQARVLGVPAAHFKV